MNTVLKKLSPYLVILLGMFTLFFIGQAEVAFGCFILGIILIIERFWPEKWGEDSRKF